MMHTHKSWDWLAQITALDQRSSRTCNDMALCNEISLTMAQWGRKFIKLGLHDYAVN